MGIFELDAFYLIHFLFLQIKSYINIIYMLMWWAFVLFQQGSGATILIGPKIEGLALAPQNVRGKWGEDEHSRFRSASHPLPLLLEPSWHCFTILTPLGLVCLLDVFLFVPSCWSQHCHSPLRDCWTTISGKVAKISVKAKMSSFGRVRVIVALLITLRK